MAGSLKSIFASSLNIITPTITRTGYIAFPGIALKSGNIKRVKTKNSAVNTTVSPVLPPSSTPLALSAKAVVVETPSKEPEVEAKASTQSAFSNLFIPSLSSKSLARFPTPESVPSESKS